MNNLVDSDIQRFVACLVLGYLENQQLESAYDEFCETSRHLVKEKQGLKYGNKLLDTSVGLVNIVRDYYTLKSRINEFLRISPHSPFIIRLIDTEDTLQRLEIILHTLTENLHKIEKLQPGSTKKRKLEQEENIFDISHSKTSTPETFHPSKRLKKSLSTPFLTISANKSNKAKSVDKSVVGRSELKYAASSSSDTSIKEDDEEESGSKEPPSLIASKANIEQLSESCLQKQDFADKVADIINRTRSAKETETKESADKGLSNADLNDILSKTQNDPSFDDIVNDIVNKYLLEYPEGDNVAQTSSTFEQSSETKEVPIKQRLRPRNEKKEPMSQRKKKINIISNEVYTGVVPEVANLHPMIVEPVQEMPHVLVNLPVFLQNGNEFIPILQSIPTTSEIAVMPQVTNEVAVVPQVTQEIIEPVPDKPEEKKTQLQSEGEKKESTPKMKINPSFIESKSKSTPRRKATHVRILDFNHTPSSRKLSMIKELSTPVASSIPATTPGSAPATISSAKISKINRENSQAVEVVDESSNSNSISHTPKVVKDRRRRKIEITKSAEKTQPPEELKQPNMSLDDWFNMRKQSKDLPIDQQVRKANEKAEAEGKVGRQKRRTPKRRSVKKKAAAKGQKSPSRSPDEQKENKEKNAEENSPVEFDEDKPLSSIKFKIKSPRKQAAVKKKRCEKAKKGSATEKTETDSKTVEVPREDGPSSSSLNRSDTVQEVATMLTTLSETILAKDCNVKSMELLETPFKIANEIPETPFKENSLTPLPNTPRFAIPLISQPSQETPMPKIFGNVSTTAMSLVKICDILTPSFPITPGIKETPLKEGEGSPASGYSSRRTDYSSCSSYYKPDESEDVNPDFLNPRKRSERNSQSESDVEKPPKILGSVKKVECQVPLERVKSFEQEVMPHYTMMDEGLLSESMVGTATEDSSDSSSSFTCSTCSTDPSDDENTMDKLNKVTTEVDSEWNCDEEEREVTASPAVVDEKTGEVRFPLRNWITPKKCEPEEVRPPQVEISRPKTPPKEIDPVSIQEAHERRAKEMEKVRQRTLEKIRLESAAQKPKAQNQPKFRKSNVKNFKLPSEETHKPTVVSRKDQILQQNLTERPRPTPLKLIPSSSSRRKNATPRKTIVIDELPRQPSPVKKKREKKQESSSKKDVLTLDSVTDNAIMPETSLNSSSFDDSKTEDGPNDFSQGFKENESKVQQTEKPASPSASDYDEEDSLEMITAAAMKKFEFHFVEPEGFKRQEKATTACKVSPMIINFDGEKITLKSSGIIEAFSIEPKSEVKSSKKSPKKSQNEKEAATKNGTSSSENQSSLQKSKIKINIKAKEKQVKNPSFDINSTEILEILEKLHGK